MEYHFVCSKRRSLLFVFERFVPRNVVSEFSGSAPKSACNQDGGLGVNGQLWGGPRPKRQRQARRGSRPGLEAVRSSLLQPMVCRCSAWGRHSTWGRRSHGVAPVLGALESLGSPRPLGSPQPLGSQQPTGSPDPMGSVLSRGYVDVCGTCSVLCARLYDFQAATFVLRFCLHELCVRHEIQKTCAACGLRCVTCCAFMCMCGVRCARAHVMIQMRS